MIKEERDRLFAQNGWSKNDVRLLLKYIEELEASRDSRILSAVPSELPALISDLIEYFEPLADADASGDPLEYRGNMEMSLLTRLQEIERGIAG